MDFEATVFLVLPVVKGISAATQQEWVKQEVVFEFQQGQYTRKICVGFWNDKAPAAAALKVGDNVLVSVNIESRERNGRWFTEARGWRFSAVPAGQSAAGGFGQQGYNIQNQGGYGAPAQGYGAPAPAYGAPAPSYGAPAPAYGAPAPAAAPAPAVAPAPAPADDLPF